MSSQVLTKMLELIKNGQLSHADVIEEMINNGLLPVDVTEIGKIPITVGTFGSVANVASSEFSNAAKAEISPKLRIQNLRSRKPTTSGTSTTSTTPTVSHDDDMIDVDLGPIPLNFYCINQWLAPMNLPTSNELAWMVLTTYLLLTIQ